MNENTPINAPWVNRGERAEVKLTERKPLRKYLQKGKDSSTIIEITAYHREHKDGTEVTERREEYGYTENELATKVIGCAIEVHRQLGPGLLESAYQRCLVFELQKAKLNIEVEKPIPLFYKEIKMEVGYRLDILVENKLIVEVKSIEAINDIHIAQCLTYLKVADKKLALMINFNTVMIKNGIKRLINGQLNSVHF